MRIAPVALMIAFGCKTPGPSPADDYWRKTASQEAKLVDDGSSLKALDYQSPKLQPAASGGDSRLLNPFLPAQVKPLGNNVLSPLNAEHARKAIWEISETYFGKSSRSEGRSRSDDSCYLDKVLNGASAFATYPGNYAYKLAYNVDKLDCANSNDPSAKPLVATEQVYQHRSCFGLDVSKVDTLRSMLGFKDECQFGSLQTQGFYLDKTEILSEGVAHVLSRTRSVARQDAESLPCREVKVGQQTSFAKPCLITVMLLVEIDGNPVANNFSQLVLGENVSRSDSKLKYPTAGISKIIVNQWEGTIFFEPSGTKPTYSIGFGDSHFKGEISPN